MIGSIPSLRRHVKNVACNYSDAQVKVREATSNDPWGPSSSLMSEIADMTFSALAFSEIMQMIWKRLNDHGKNWRHVYKSLVLLDYLIKLGSEKVAQQCRENIYAIQTLKDFQHVEDNKDQGINVREKAKQLVSLLKDEERLKNERSRAQIARKRFTQHGMGISCDGSTNAGRTRETVFRAVDSDFEECRPSSLGEEELQLRIALALSKEEAHKEEVSRKDDDVRFQLALKQSQSNQSTALATPTSKMTASPADQVQQTTSAMDDLLSLQQVFSTGPSTSAAEGQSDAALQSSPWSSFVPPPAANDPWAAPTSVPESNAALTTKIATKDPFGVGEAQNDPWMPVDQAPIDLLNQSLNNDEFSTISAPLGSNQINFDSTLSGVPFQNGTSKEQSFPIDNDVTKRNLRTPESFLGENSSLVNLDNLLGPPKQIASGFAGDNQISAGNSYNPFLAQQRPTPTLNEMRSASSISNPSVPSSNATAGGAWTLQQPLQPQRPSSTNPFL